MIAGLPEVPHRRETGPIDDQHGNSDARHHGNSIVRGVTNVPGDHSVLRGPTALGEVAGYVVVTLAIEK